ncbi:phosphate signaling complex protein PhoU [Bombilactobacillus mellis]|uniref:phosphate signaling complex protein PhoU n=1 Tax=Bombilactobacillus mellis TaxID=1218508 RepID=UPI001DA73C5C|nr:phosphate signaling complex protein PhoU [Bombilactobacillus mellis]NUG66358.1 phosphate signaling complex protein PhoU [Bombilactobacillus mellis]
MRNEFETELKNLHIRFSEMAMMVNEAIQKSVTAFITHDQELAKKVIQNDQNINNREIDLEKRSFEMIALQQPVTSDLRMIVTILKASSDLERMGDHAVSIARATSRLQKNAILPEVEQLISKISHLVESMFNQAIEAYLQQDDQQAIEIALEDNDIDKLVRTVNQTCIQSMKTNPQAVENGTTYMLVANYLERTGDYVTNLCEWVVYLKQGKLSDLNSKNIG